MSNESPDIGSFAVVALLSGVIGLYIGGFVAGRLGLTLGTIASGITILGGVYGGHRILKEYDINIVKSLVGESQTDDYGFLFVPTPTNLKKDEKFAQEIITSSEWNYDGHGNHPELARRFLARIFESDKFSNRRMEVIILLLTTFSLSIFLLIFADAIGEFSSSAGILQSIARLYPDSLSIRQSAIPLLLSTAGTFIGFTYLYSKAATTCPEGVPFSLKSEGRYFRQKDLQQETRRNDQGDTYEVTIAYGQQVYRCLEHDAYFVKNTEWNRS